MLMLFPAGFKKGKIQKMSGKAQLNIDISGGGGVLDARDQIIEGILAENKKFNQIISLYERWMKLKNDNGGVFAFIRDNGFKRVVVYGMGSLGRSLCGELSTHNIEVPYVMDRRKEVPCSYPLYAVEDNLPDADLIIVTAISAYEEIKKKLGEKMGCPILSLDDIIP